MPCHPGNPQPDRRAFLGAAALALATSPLAAADTKAPPEKGKPTRFQIACMTLPYARFSFERALTGIKAAGYRHVAWGSTHTDADGKRVAILANDAPAERAKEPAKQCRDLGLEPVLLFGPSPEDVAGLKRRIAQAGAAGIAQVLTFGTTKGNDPKVWVKNFKELGPIARDHGVTIVVKQHGGNTGFGAVCADITRAVNDDGVKVCYDAGNVMDYHKVDPIPGPEEVCRRGAQLLHQGPPRLPEGPGLRPRAGRDRSLQAVAPGGVHGPADAVVLRKHLRALLPPPEKPEGVDALARRAREFLELVIQGLQA